MNELLIFEVGSSFGHFRKPFTSTNSLTHAVIPRSAVEGLVGAILGLKSDEYPEKLQESKIAVEILSPVQKYHMKINYVHEDWWHLADSYLLNKPTERTVSGYHTPTNTEYLVNPKYRIYFSNSDLNSELENFLENQQSVYTPYLGKSSMIAWINYIGKFNYEKDSSDDYVNVSSIIPYTDNLPNIKTSSNTRFGLEEGLTLHITKDRISQGTYNAVISENLTDIPVKGVEINKITMNGNSPNIVFLPIRV